MDEIVIKNLTKYYGNSVGIKDLSFEIKKGEFFGFVGKNGAGKSTTIRLLLDLLKPTSGSASIRGYAVFSASKDLKKIIAYLPSELFFYSNITAKKLFDYTSSFLDFDCSQNLEFLIDYFELDINKKIDEMSLGNKKKVAIINCFLKNPDIYILDEPTSGLDPIIQERFFSLLTKENSLGKTIFMSSHNLVDISKYCSRTAIIKDGLLQKIVSKEELELSSKYHVVYRENGKEHDLIYSKDINDLIALLNNKNIQSLTINKITIEEEFLKSYGEVTINEK